jgi:ABC-type branched-subunit amino acid transport system substrate-binding protein
VWQLEGAAETWPQQLEAHYRKEPVFALIGGITSGEWAPIHDFCERMGVPNLFPITDYPVISDSDWYTLYFSKGYYQEGDAAARFLRRAEAIPRDASVVQVYRGKRRGQALARGFSEARGKMGLPAAKDIELAADAKTDRKFWKGLAAENPGAVLVVWLDGDEIASLGALAAVKPRPSMVIASSTVLGESLYSLPEALRSFTFLTHPGSFAEDEVRSRMATERWLQAKKLPITNFEIQARMYFLGWTLAPMVKMMRDDFYRDYFFDIVDMMRDQYYSIAVYPRLSFGPGQRYASKGCYIVQLTGGDEPKLEKKSNWVVH